MPVKTFCKLPVSCTQMRNHSASHLCAEHQIMCHHHITSNNTRAESLIDDVQSLAGNGVSRSGMAGGGQHKR